MSAREGGTDEPDVTLEPIVLGDRPATIQEIRSFPLHGMTYHDVALRFEDDSTTSARLGPEAVPDGLEAGDRVVVTMAAGLVLSISRA